MASGLPKRCSSRRGGGTSSRTEPEQVDLHRFEAMIDQGRKALADRDPAGASALLREALDLWRGPPLAGLEDEPFAQPYIARIEDLRLTAVEDRIEADLAWVGTPSWWVNCRRSRRSSRCASGCGGSSCWPCTDRDVRPRRSRPIGTRSGCSPRSWGSIRRPTSSAWRERSSAQDPDLDLVPVPAGPAPAEPQEPGQGARGPRRVWLVAVGSALVLGAVAAVVIVLTSSSGVTPPAAVAAEQRRQDRRKRRGSSWPTIPTTGTAPSAVVWANGSLWVANTVSRTVARIDPATDRVVATVPSAGAPTDLAAGEGAVWVLNGLDGTVVAIDPRSNEASDPIEVPPVPPASRSVAGPCG